MLEEEGEGYVGLLSPRSRPVCLAQLYGIVYPSFTRFIDPSFPPPMHLREVAHRGEEQKGMGVGCWICSVELLRERICVSRCISCKWRSSRHSDRVDIVNVMTEANKNDIASFCEESHQGLLCVLRRNYPPCGEPY